MGAYSFSQPRHPNGQFAPVSAAWNAPMPPVASHFPPHLAAHLASMPPHAPVQMPPMASIPTTQVVSAPTMPNMVSASATPAPTPPPNTTTPAKSTSDVRPGYEGMFDALMQITQKKYAMQSNSTPNSTGTSFNPFTQTYEGPNAEAVSASLVDPDEQFDRYLRKFDGDPVERVKATVKYQMEKQNSRLVQASGGQFILPSDNGQQFRNGCQKPFLGNCSWEIVPRLDPVALHLLNTTSAVNVHGSNPIDRMTYDGSLFVKNAPSEYRTHTMRMA